MILDQLDDTTKLKTLSAKELEALCAEVRDTIITTTSKTGGHLASNLGVVELTVAIHRVFDSPIDQIIWDVGHQCYTHKLLTGRLDRFSTLRQEGGLSGFPKSGESVHDAFLSGHSGNSISAGYGILAGKKLRGEPGHVVSIIGDGSFTNGLAYEGLNNAGRSGEKMVIILNDNEMSISQNVGGLATYLARIRAKPTYFKAKDTAEAILLAIPLIGRPIRNLLSRTKRLVKQLLYNSNLFEDLGYTYLGPVDGHNLTSLQNILRRAKSLEKPVIVHVKTKKGKGYSFAEEHPDHFHGVGPFDIASGAPLKANGESYSAVFGETLVEMAEKDERICALTAAMLDGTGLEHFRERFSGTGRFIDVGIAESHAITFGAGLSAKGYVPVFAVYSTFIQRGYDQVLHDASIEKRHMVLAIDRAGVVGDDGETHQGLFDVALLSPIPGITIYAPSFYSELQACLEQAVNAHDGVVVVRYPKGKEPKLDNDYSDESLCYKLYPTLEASTLIVTYGRIFGEAILAQQALVERGAAVSVLKLTRVNPIDPEAVKSALAYGEIHFFEEGIKTGSIAQQFASMLTEQGYSGKVYIHAVENQFVPQSSIPSAYKNLGLDCEGMVKQITKGMTLGVGESKAT